MESPRQPLPPFNDVQDAIKKVRLAEDAWNSRDPERVSLAYSPDSAWRNRDRFITGRAEIVAFLRDKWQREAEYRLIKELWSFHSNRIAVRFAYEWHDSQANWFRSYGNENWEFDENGYVVKRHASINDVAITDSQRLFHWPQGRRPTIIPLSVNWGYRHSLTGAMGDPNCHRASCVMCHQKHNGCRQGRD